MSSKLFTGAMLPAGEREESPREVACSPRYPFWIHPRSPLDLLPPLPEWEGQGQPGPGPARSGGNVHRPEPTSLSSGLGRP